MPELRRNQQMCRSYESDSIFGEKGVDLLNTLQKTAWRVDDRILAVAQVLDEKRIPVKSFLVANIDKPEKANAPQQIFDDPDKLKQWKSEQHPVHISYHQQIKKAYRTRQVLSMAKEFEFRIYFLSWSLDWRERFYSQQSWLTPLSTVFEKALMKFRDGCKLNADALDWCKSALGAAYNGTRISFQQRIQWTDDNAELLKRIANESLSSIAEWEVVKDPWQFLQLCLEWNDVVVTKKEKFWRVSIGADSTASGLQFLSAARRDPVGMKYASLHEPETPSAPSQDAYMRV